MKNITIFGLWLLTIVIGSIIFSFGVFIFSGDGNFENLVGIAFISMIAATLFSVPAIITFLVSNNNLQYKYGNTGYYRRKMYNINLITGGIYFMTSMFLVLLEGSDAIGMAVVFGLLVSYLPVGIISWYVFFEKSKNGKVELSEDIIDDFVNE